MSSDLWCGFTSGSDHLPYRTKEIKNSKTEYDRQIVDQFLVDRCEADETCSIMLSQYWINK